VHEARRVRRERKRIDFFIYWDSVISGFFGILGVFGIFGVFGIIGIFGIPAFRHSDIKI
jgi:hypothetical protein